MKQATQISRPMQIALVACLVLFAVWFGFIKPKAATNDVAATPVTPAVSQATAASTPGSTNSALDKTAYSEVKVAKDAAATASSDAAKTSGQTGEGGTADAAAADAATARSTKTKASTAATATTPAASAATTPAAAGAAATAATPTTAAATASAAKAAPTVAPAQRHANHVILKIKKDLAARNAVVVLVWSSKGDEDKILHRRITKEIDLRHGKVKTFFIPVSQVGRYDGLLSGLNLGQTPSTIVIAPNNQAQVIGGLTSTARLDRLTSAAVLTKPAATTP